MYDEFGGKVKQREEQGNEKGPSTSDWKKCSTHRSSSRPRQYRDKNKKSSNTEQHSPRARDDRGHILDHECQQIGKEHGRVTIKKQNSIKTTEPKNKTIPATNPNSKLLSRWLLI